MPFTTMAHVPHEEQAHAIADDLHVAGFQSSAISVVFPAGQGEDLMRLVPSENLRLAGTNLRGIPDFNGRITGITATVPSRSNRWLATGPILTILSGIRLRGAMDGLVEALAGLGVPDPDARHFAALTEAGHILVIVRTDDGISAQLVEETLRHHGGHEIAQFTWPA